MSDTTDTAAPAADAPEKRRGNPRRKWYLLALAAFFVIVGAAYGAYYLLVAQYYAETKDAYVEGNQVALTPQISGTVTAIHAEETDTVQAGDTLVELDESDVDNRLEQARARLASAVREVHQLFARTREQRATVSLRETELDQARRDYTRNRRLIEVHGVTQEAFEHSRAAYHQAQSQLTAAQARLAELEAQTEGTTLRTHPQVAQAGANLKDAWLDVQRARVPAPVSGFVAQRDVQLGQKIDPGQKMLSIVPLDNVWVDANFKETDLAAMRIGQSVHLTADFYGDDVVYHGRVAGISAGTGAAFELLPPQNATGNWIKIVRRVPVRIELDRDELEKHPLRLGLSMDVTVDLHDTSGKMLASAPPARAPLTTDVYQRRDAAAQPVIDRIIDANDGDPATTSEPAHRAIGRLSTHS